MASQDKKSIPEQLKTWLLEVVREAVQVCIDVCTEPKNLVKIKYAFYLWTSDTAIEAPKAGVADNELKKKILESGILDIPIPEKYKTKK